MYSVKMYTFELMNAFYLSIVPMNMIQWHVSVEGSLISIDICRWIQCLQKNFFLNNGFRISIYFIEIFFTWSKMHRILIV